MKLRAALKEILDIKVGHSHSYRVWAGNLTPPEAKRILGVNLTSKILVDEREMMIRTLTKDRNGPIKLKDGNYRQTAVINVLSPICSKVGGNKTTAKKISQLLKFHLPSMGVAA